MVCGMHLTAFTSSSKPSKSAGFQKVQNFGMIWGLWLAGHPVSTASVKASK